MNTYTQGKSRYYELDIMRFLAALAVLFYHYTFYASRMDGTPVFGVDRILRYGYLGVDAFFMISGYVVLMSSMHKSPKSFVISRIARLYPAYWVSCLLVFCILYFGKISAPGIPAATFKLLAYNLTMLQGFFGKDHLIGVFWTLTYEIGFYFIILIISALNLWKNLLLIISIWLMYTFIAGPNSSNNAFSFLLIPKFSCCFIAGMLFYLLRISYASGWKIYSLLFLCLLLNLKNDMPILENMNVYFHEPDAYNKYILAIIIVGFYTFFLFSALGKINSPQLKFLARLGNLTYPLYLTHVFGIGVFMVLGTRINKYLLLFIVTCTALLLAAVIYNFVEKRTHTSFKILVSKAMDLLH